MIAKHMPIKIIHMAISLNVNTAVTASRASPMSFNNLNIEFTPGKLKMCLTLGQ